MGNPKMGDVVFYISPDQVQDFKGLSKVFAAIVARVFADGTVNLVVFDDRHQVMKHEFHVKQISKAGQTAVFFVPQATAAAAPPPPPPPPPAPAPIPTAVPAAEPTTPAPAPTPIVTTAPPVAEAAAPAPSL